MKALILAAGYATRLYPLTKEYPKPLLEIGKRHLIDYIVDKLNSIQEIDEIIVVTNSKFILQFKHWAGGLKSQKQLSLIDDLTSDLQHKRGAVGDINFVIENKGIKDDLLVIGGDNLFDGNLQDLLLFARKHKPYSVIGVYDIKDKQQTNKYGVLKLDKENKIIDFKEKPKRADSTLVAMCLYFFSKEKLGLLKEYLDKKTDQQDATGFYIDWLRSKEPTYGYVFAGRWYDIGDSKFYYKAKREFSLKIGG